jgi:hypothetical protein
MGGARFRHPATEIVGRLACLDQAPLRAGEPFVGVLLLVFDPRNGPARLVLTAVEGGALFFGLPALACQLLVFLGETVASSAACCSCARSRRWLFLLVMLGVQGSDGVGRLGARGFERGWPPRQDRSMRRGRLESARAVP